MKNDEDFIFDPNGRHRILLMVSTYVIGIIPSPDREIIITLLMEKVRKSGIFQICSQSSYNYISIIKYSLCRNVLTK